MAVSEVYTRPAFPPLLTGRAVIAPQDPWRAAWDGASTGALGAGDLIYSTDTDRLALALVLEPDVPRSRCFEMVPLAMAAFADAAGAVIPSEIGVTFTWPNIIRLNGAEVGRVQCALGKDQDPPSFMCLGLMVRMALLPTDNPGETPDQTSFFNEGCGDVDTLDVLESYGRNLVHWLHRWDTEGFGPVHRHWWDRRDQTLPLTPSIDGRMAGMDENGNAILSEGATPGVTMAEAMA